MLRHVRRLSEDPWLTGRPHELTRSERRGVRARVAPTFEPGWTIYASDGAARQQGATGQRQSSCGSVRFHAGERRVVACCGTFLGDVTNNEAEYAGVLLSVEHAVENPAPRMRFLLDSLLVARQLRYEWRCACITLRPAYERALAMLERLRRLPSVEEVRIYHVYREFNTDADSVCNLVLDRVASNVPPDAPGRHVFVNWAPLGQARLAS